MAVYVFGEPDVSLVKVGRTGSPRNRVTELQRLTRNPQADMLYVNRRAGGQVEQRALRILRSRFWFEGEWFVCGASVAKSVIRHTARAAARKRKARLSSRRSSRRAIKRLRKMGLMP